jgi:hypothetical protein
MSCVNLAQSINLSQAKLLSLSKWHLVRTQLQGRVTEESEWLGERRNDPILGCARKSSEMQISMLGEYCASPCSIFASLLKNMSWEESVVGGGIHKTAHGGHFQHTGDPDATVQRPLWLFANVENIFFYTFLRAPMRYLKLCASSSVLQLLKSRGFYEPLILSPPARMRTYVNKCRHERRLTNLHANHQLLVVLHDGHGPGCH